MPSGFITMRLMSLIGFLANRLIVLPRMGAAMTVTREVAPWSRKFFDTAPVNPEDAAKDVDIPDRVDGSIAPITNSLRLSVHEFPDPGEGRPNHPSVKKFHAFVPKNA